MTDIYIAKTDILCDKNEFQKRYENLPAERKEKIDRLRFDGDKRLSLGAWLLLCMALNEKGIQRHEIILVKNESGKPFLKERSDIFFNLSHSGNTVMCAVSDGEVGCDVQEIKKADTRISDRFFHKREAEEISRISDKNERQHMFFRYWTLKESFMKATGLGFSLPLKEFCIHLSGDNITIEQQKFPDEKFYFKEYSQNDGYGYAVCSKTDGFSDMNSVEF